MKVLRERHCGGCCILYCTVNIFYPSHLAHSDVHVSRTNSHPGSRAYSYAHSHA